MTTPLLRIVDAEVLKVRSVRSYRVAAACGALGVVALAVMLAVAEGRDSPVWLAQPVALPLEYFAYVAMVLGALAVTSEFSSGTGMLTASLIPWRGSALLGKYIAVVALALAVSVVVTSAVVIGDWLGAGTSAAQLTSDEAIAVILAGLCSIPVAAALGVAFGYVFRSTALALALLMLWSLVVETALIFVLPENVGAWMPFKTIGGSRLVVDQLGAYEGVAIFAGYTAIAIAAGALVHLRRDIDST